MGKYDHVIKQLPPLPWRGNSEDYQHRVELAKADMMSAPGTTGVFQLLSGSLKLLATDASNNSVVASDIGGAAWLAETYKRLRRLRDDLETIRSSLDLRIEATSQMVVDHYEAENIEMLRLASGGSVTVYPEPYTGVEDRDKLREWAVANGYETQLTLPWQTVNSLAKERLLASEEPPPGVKVFLKNKVVLRQK